MNSFILSNVIYYLLVWHLCSCKSSQKTEKIQLRCLRIITIISLATKFKTHEVTTWLTTFTIHILLNISRSKDNQTMKLGQFIEYNKGNIFLQKYAQNEMGSLVPDLFLFFEKT